MKKSDHDPESGSHAEDEDVYVIDADALEEETGLEQVSEGSSPAADQTFHSPAGGGGDDGRLRAELTEWKDRSLRLRADFDNFRKRMEREKSEYYRYALVGVVKELLPVIDNFERALSSGSTAGGEEFVRGIELIYKQLLDVLQKQGLRMVEAEGVRFDPNVHEAVTSEENPEIPSHTVAEVLQPGYFLQDRLIRPAMVKVSTGGPEPARTQDDDETPVG